MNTRKILLSSILASMVCAAGASDDTETQALDQINVSYSGDDSRVGIGITENGDFIGDFLKSFNTTYKSNFMAQGWYSDGAGGLELDYHWISGNPTEMELIENADNYKINKLFFAIDQNTYDDRKISIGGGQEKQNKFWNINLSKAITDERLVSDVSTFDYNTLYGTIDGLDYMQDQTIETITRTYEQAYDWGIGARVGKFFDAGLVRLTGGLDYEKGDYNSDQLTASIDVEKYFSNSGHSIALSLRQLSKDGDFELDKDDTRAYLMYRYDFGKTYKPTERYEEIKMVDEEALARLKEQRRVVVQNEINLSSMAFFDFDSYVLREDTITALKDVVEKIKAETLGSKINIVGHTCSIGTDDYNQTLSENRAKAALDFFIANGVNPQLLLSSGKGESEPAFDNNNKQEQPKNRRVVVSFLTVEKDYKEAEIPAEDVPVKWVKQPVKTAPSWLSRALRNPAKHKRTVDVYKYQEQEQVETLGDIVFLNQAPIADDDTLTVFRNSGATFVDVLNNDSDPDNDNLTITDVMQPANGTVVNNGTSLTYTPNEGFIGTDAFEYTIDDGNGDQDAAVVSVEVLNNNPEANDDSATVTEGESTVLDVLANDSDTDGSELSIDSVTQAQNGTVTINSDGTLSYLSNDGYVGTDSFTYTITDADGGLSTANVSIVVESGNNPPVANDDMYQVAINGSLDFNPLENDSDPDGDSISLLSVDMSTLNGTLTINEDGSMSYQASHIFSGNDIFTYTIIDANGDTATATVTLCVAD